MEYGLIFHGTRTGKYYCKNMKYRINVYTSTECKTLKGERRMIFIFNIITALNYNQDRGIFCPCGKDALSTGINNKIIQHSFFSLPYWLTL